MIDRKAIAIAVTAFVIGAGIGYATTPQNAPDAPQAQIVRDAPPPQFAAIESTTTTTTSIPIVIAVGKRKQCGEDINAKLIEYGLPIKFFSYIAYRESRCNPNAINATWDSAGNMTYALNRNKTYDSGLLQINSGHRELVRQICGKKALDNNLAGLRDIDCNLAVAARLYDNGKGLGHWRATLTEAHKHP